MRKYKTLSPKIENQIWALKDQTDELLADNTEEAETKIKQAWDLIPEPKFKWGIAHTTLYDYVTVLNINTRHTKAFELLDHCIKDLESTGHEIMDSTAYIRMGETLLYMDQITESKKYFDSAYEIEERGFTNEPKLYLEIAKAKDLDIDAIKAALNEMKNAKTGTPPSDDPLNEKIDALIEKGNKYAAEEDYKNAIWTWEEALALVPEPKNQQEETSWLYASIGDAHFLLENYPEAKESFFNAKSCIAGDTNNPFIMLRLGQSYFECNDLDNAAEYLMRAYMIEGKAMFKHEDKKYLAFLKTKADLSPPGFFGRLSKLF